MRRYRLRVLKQESGARKAKTWGDSFAAACFGGVVTDPKAVVSERVGDLTFRFRAGEFFQNNLILPYMVDHVVGEANLKVLACLVMRIVVPDCLRFQPLLLSNKLLEWK